MKKNNKGVTLVELIVSFAIVSVAVIYFFQTIFTVKKIYVESNETTIINAEKTYAIKLLDKYLDNNLDLDNFCNSVGNCENVKISSVIADSILKYDITGIKYGSDNSKTTNATLFRIIRPNINTIEGEKDGYYWDYFPGYKGLTAKHNDLQVSYSGTSSYYLGPFKGKLINLTLSNGVDCSGGETKDGKTKIYIVKNKNDVKSVSPYREVSNNHTTWNKIELNYNTNGNYKEEYYIYVKLTHDDAGGCTSHVALDNIKIEP